MEVKVGIPIAVTIPLYKTCRRCFFAMSLPPSSPFFCNQQISKAVIHDTYSLIFLDRKPCENIVILTFLLFTSVEGPSVGSGMNLAIHAKNITPPKN